LLLYGISFGVEISFLEGEKEISRVDGISKVQKMKAEQKGPIRKWKEGRFQVSIWKRKKVLKAKSDFDVEREVEPVRACIQFSSFSRVTQTWENQRIWCMPDDLGTLARLLDASDEKEDGDEVE